MAAIKTDMLAEIEADLPDGIRNFLTTPLPAAPTLTTPDTVEHAIICQAEFCVWLANLCGDFEGITPISIPLWIGQLNTVNQSILLASLEYKADSQAETDFEITEPTEGTAYGPGELRISARALHDSNILAISATLNEEEFDLVERDGVWRQYVELTEYDEYTLTLTATFGDKSTANKSVSFSVVDPDEVPPEEEQPEPPGGSDDTAVEEARSKMEEALAALADQSVLDVYGYAEKSLNVLKAQYAVLGSIGKKIAKGDAIGVIDETLDEVEGVLDNFDEKIVNYDPNDDPSKIGYIVGRLWQIKERLVGYIF